MEFEIWDSLTAGQITLEAAVQQGLAIRLYHLCMSNQTGVHGRSYEGPFQAYHAYRDLKPTQKGSGPVENSSKSLNGALMKYAKALSFLGSKSLSIKPTKPCVHVYMCICMCICMCIYEYIYMHVCYLVYQFTLSFVYVYI